jgi:transcriptional regulator with XRE-family HTH domain
MNNKEKTLSYKFGKRIKFERIKLDWSQEILAEKANISRSTITSVERNTSSPTLDVVEKLAKALGYEPHELLIFKDLEI